MITIFFRFWRKASVALLMGVLLFSYTELPESVAVLYDTFGKPTAFLDKSTFFYGATFLFIFFNLLLGLLRNQLSKIDFSKVNPLSIWAKEKEQLADVLAGWAEAFNALINTYLVFVLMGLKNINSDTEQNLTVNMNWILIIGAVILLILIFFLPLRLLYSNPKIRN